MRMIRPRLDTYQLEIAKDQTEYASITAAVVCHPSFRVVKTEMGALNTLVVAFLPNEAERARLAAGEAVYLSMMTLLSPMHPILMHVGPEEPAALYGVPVEVPVAPVGTCSRCTQAIKDFAPPRDGFTAGYYDVRARVRDGFENEYAKYANPGEVFLCDACMWADPRYIARYLPAAPNSLDVKSTTFEPPRPFDPTSQGDGDDDEAET